MSNQAIRRSAGRSFRRMWLSITAILMLVIAAWQHPDDSKLAQTRWAGVMAIPSEEKVILDFTNDRFNLIFEHDTVEISAYQVKGDTVTFKKVSGRSPCADEAGIYTYRIQNNKLTFKLLKEDCPARSQAFMPDGYQKVVK